MKERFKNDLLLLLNQYLDSDTLRIIDTKIDMILSNYEIEEPHTQLVPYEYKVPETIQIYIVTKKISGLSDKSLYLYNIVLNDFFQAIQKSNDKVTANDIRIYLYKYQKDHNISNRTLDCRRTIICSYFGWLASEEYIFKNPAINIQPIKYERKHKKPMSQLDLEKVRSACETNREKAIVEMLYSTCCRVSEIVNLDISHVNFLREEAIVKGKGNKERKVYISRTAMHYLQEYISDREINADSPLFANKSWKRWSKHSIEKLIKSIAKKVEVDNAHPHRFRRTFATNALNKGMSVQCLQKILGHQSLDVTMKYCTVDDDTARIEHRRVA